MSPTRWVLSIVGLGAFAGFGLWTWFLADKTLDVADQWSSVLSGFASLFGLALSTLALLLNGRGSGSRSVHIGGDSTGTFTLGDQSPIDRTER